MKKHVALVCLLLQFCFTGQGQLQTLPIKIDVPPVSDDPGVMLNLLHFDSPEKDKYTLLHFQTVNASVLRAGEFVPDTGGMVYRDRKLQEPCYSSNVVLLLRKQLIDGTGKQLSVTQWLVATRKLDAGNEYKLYFPRKFKHPLINNRSVLDLSIYNLDAIRGLDPNEVTALSELTRNMIEPGETVHVASTNAPNTGTLAQDIKEMKRQFKSLRETGLSFKGDLPSNEKLITRYPIVSDRIFTITKTKTTPTYLKCYITADYKTFDFLDSVKIDGDVEITSVATIYNMDSYAVGAFANLHYKQAGSEGPKQLSIAMDADYHISSWVHSVGKNKLNSMATEMCWFDAGKLWVLSNNRERIFKTYVQMHHFIPGQEAKQAYPASEEEKGSEKSGFLKTFQPPPPVQGTNVTPNPDQYVPFYITMMGQTRYIIAQGTRVDMSTTRREYLGANIYRIEASGKVTNVGIVSEYRGEGPLAISKIIRNSNAEYYLFPLQVHLQLSCFEDHSELSPLTEDNTVMMENRKNEFVVNAPGGSLLLKRSAVGSRYTFLYYPVQ